MIDTPLAFIVIVGGLALLITAVFRPLRSASRLSDREDAADLAATERRIEEIEREARKGE